MGKTAKKASGLGIEWYAMSLRTTLFFTQPSKDLKGCWQDLIGEAPAEITQKPADGTFNEVGSYKSGTLSIVSRHDRIDLHYTMNDSFLPGFSSLGPFLEAKMVIDDLSHKLFEKNTSQVSRLALGVVLVSPTKSRNDSYKKLGELIPTVKVPVGDSVSDFTFSINRKKKSKIKKFDENINRIRTLKGIQRFLVPISADITPNSISASYFVFLELDINTPKERLEPIEASLLPSIYSELGEFAEEIANKGDI